MWGPVLKQSSQKSSTVIALDKSLKSSDEGLLDIMEDLKSQMDAVLIPEQLRGCRPKRPIDNNEIERNSSDKEPLGILEDLRLQINIALSLKQWERSEPDSLIDDQEVEWPLTRGDKPPDAPEPRSADEPYSRPSSSSFTRYGTHFMMVWFYRFVIYVT
jgi:hypothetical protein